MITNEILPDDRVGLKKVPNWQINSIDKRKKSGIVSRPLASLFELFENLYVMKMTIMDRVISIVIQNHTVEVNGKV